MRVEAEGPARAQNSEVQQDTKRARRNITLFYAAIAVIVAIAIHRNVLMCPAARFGSGHIMESCDEHRTRTIPEATLINPS